MTAADVFTETAAIREAGFLRSRFQAEGISTLAYIATADLTEAITDLAGGAVDGFSLRAASNEMFAMDEKSRMEAIAGLAEDDPKSYLAAHLAA
ncbi:hypothetical protein [Arthrobacter sp. 2MCAF14]|uniref:hypothetical protein n=1 Tax=Arthrobacter sp. 2MCAF14 TaxID=3232982 RepID=UPI003F9246D9